MKIKLFFIFFLLTLFSPAFAMVNPEKKVAEVIKGFVISKYSNFAKDEIKVLLKQSDATLGKLAAYEEDAPLKILEGYPDFKPLGNVIFPLAVGVGDKSVKLFVRAKVEVLKNIAAAAKYIKKGKTLEVSDLKTEMRDVALLPQKYFSEGESLVGKEAKLGIPENSTLFDWMVGDLPMVRQGSPVSILVSLPGLLVRAKGEALEDGSAGGEIRVRRSDSKKIIKGKVLSPTEVEVTI